MRENDAERAHSEAIRENDRREAEEMDRPALSSWPFHAWDWTDES